MRSKVINKQISCSFVRNERNKFWTGGTCITYSLNLFCFFQINLNMYQFRLATRISSDPSIAILKIEYFQVIWTKKKRISFQWTWFFSFVHMIYCSIDFSQKMQANERTKFLLFVSNDKFSFFYCLLIPKVPVNLLWINKHFFFSKSSMLILI